jgi:hypothetical protein
MTQIQQRFVPPFFPSSGPVFAFLVGEAPGPRGADRSGIPFWGDRAGLPLYLALEAAGMAQVPPRAYEAWDGQRFRDLGLEPRLQGVALGNALPVCPTSDGQHFRAPTDRELKDPANLARLAADIHHAAGRCPGTLALFALGRRAAWVLARTGLDLPIVALAHPSAQGLLQAAPDRGRGLRLPDLQAAWQEALAARLVQLRVETQRAR